MLTNSNRKSDSSIGNMNLTKSLQHLYIPVANEQSSPMFRVMTEDRVGAGSAAPTNVTMPYKYNVRVAQIDCTAPVNPFNGAVRGEKTDRGVRDISRVVPCHKASWKYQSLDASCPNPCFQQLTGQLLKARIWPSSTTHMWL